MPSCALCTAELTAADGRRFLDGEYRICERCDVGAVQTRDTERGYNGGTGPSMGEKEITTAARRVMGDEYDRQLQVEQRWALAPAPATPDEVRIMQDYYVDQQRRIRTTVNRENARYIRKAAQNADAIEVRRVKRK